MAKAKGLGTDFGSLLPEDFDKSIMLDKSDRVQKILIEDIKPASDQPRKSFDKQSIDELALSIKTYGILQPLVVSEAENGFTIIAGERRYRAAKQNKMTHVPALVRTMKELERLEVGLIENMQRVDLSPLEQAITLAKLNEQFSIGYKEIAARIGKGHTTVVNTVRLLQLPDFARAALEEGQISEGHARAVLSLDGETSLQRQLVNKIVNEKISVRQAEQFVKNIKGTKITKQETKKSKKIVQLEKDLQKKHGAKVIISQKNSSINVSLNFKTNKEYTQFIKKIS